MYPSFVGFVSASVTATDDNVVPSLTSFNSVLEGQFPFISQQYSTVYDDVPNVQQKFITFPSNPTVISCSVGATGLYPAIPTALSVTFSPNVNPVSGLLSFNGVVVPSRQ